MAEHGLKVYGAENLADFMPALWACVGKDKELIIYTGEMLAVVAMAMEHGAAWARRLIGQVTDNHNVCRALHKMWSRNPYVNYLLGILARLLGIHLFDLSPYYTNTIHNPGTDMLSRDVLVVDKTALHRAAMEFFPGYTRVSYRALIEFLLKEGVTSPGRRYRLPGESAESIAGALACRRDQNRSAPTAKATPRARVQKPQGAMLELFSGAHAPYAFAAAGRNWGPVVFLARCGPAGLSQPETRETQRRSIS
jgi:hypothetical protein